MEFDSLSARAAGPNANPRNIHATRVIGSLDHAVLPMPPVCGLPSHSRLTMHSEWRYSM
jgi:hypothetical protein